MTPFEKIKKEISYTNNGKLMLMRLSPELLPYVPALIAEDKLRLATFIETNDAIRVA